MDKTLSNSLSLLGLSGKEVRLVISSFNLGPASVSEIAKDARLERSTAYLLVEKLLNKGILREDFKNYKKTVIAIEPKEILNLISKKQRQLRRQEIEIEERLGELQATYRASEIRPKVQVFEGNSGLLAVWQDILAVKQELLLWTNQDTESLFFSPEFHERFIKERTRKQMPIRVLAVNNLQGKKLKLQDQDSLRETKLLPERVTFSAETYIYGSKVATLDYKKDIIGIIIESQPIASSQRSVFEMAWESN